MLKTILVASIFLIVAVVLFSVRLFFVKDGEIRSGCAGKNPLLQDEGVACGLCGQVPENGECGDPDAATAVQP